MNMKHRTAEQARGEVIAQEIASAQLDYERLRSAYRELAQSEPNNEVALSMVGADMDRAHAALQLLAGQRALPVMTGDTGPAIRSPSRRMAEVDP